MVRVAPDARANQIRIPWNRGNNGNLTCQRSDDASESPPTVTKKATLYASILVKSGRYSSVRSTAGGIVYLRWLARFVSNRHSSDTAPDEIDAHTQAHSRSPSCPREISLMYRAAVQRRADRSTVSIRDPSTTCRGGQRLGCGGKIDNLSNFKFQISMSTIMNWLRIQNSHAVGAAPCRPQP